MEVRSINWDSYSHEQLYSMLVDGDGSDGKEIRYGCFVDRIPPGGNSSDAQAAWTKYQNLMGEADRRIKAALEKAGVGWQGAAADAAHGGITPLAGWNDHARQVSTDTTDQVERQTDAYYRAKNDMPQPVKVVATSNSDLLGIPGAFTHLLGGQTDQDKQEAAAQQAKQKAIDVMNSYQDQSQSDASFLQTYQDPPKTTVQVAPPQLKSSPGVGYQPDGTHPHAGGIPVRNSPSQVTQQQNSHASAVIPQPSPGSNAPTPVALTIHTHPATAQSAASVPGNARGEGFSNSEGSLAGLATGGVGDLIAGGGAAAAGFAASTGSGRSVHGLGTGRATGMRTTSDVTSPRSFSHANGIVNAATAVVKEAALGRNATGSLRTEGAPGAEGGLIGGAGTHKGEDKEHKNKFYVPTDEWFIDEDGQKYPPPVIGEIPQR